VTGASEDANAATARTMKGEPEEARCPGIMLEEPVRRQHERGSNAEVAQRLATFAIDRRG